MIYLFVTVVLFALVLPIFIIILFSFTNANYFNWPIDNFSLKWYEQFFTDSQWYMGLGRSLFVAFFTVVLSLFLGILAALATYKLDFRFKKSFISLMLSPMLIPIIIISIALYYNFAPLGLTNSYLGIVLGHSIVAFPMTFITISTGLAQVNSDIETAATSLGSTPFGVFFKITLPLIKPAVFSSAIFAFVTSIDELTITLYMSGASTKTLPIVMWETMRYNVSPLIAVASTLLVSAVIILFTFKSLLNKKTQKRRIKHEI